MVANVLVIVGYVSFYFCDPSHWLVHISISVACFGFYGLMTLGYIMVNQHCGHQARGSVMGINCLFGAVAILLIAQGGGIAFDKIDISAPFLTAAFFSFIMFLITLIYRNSIDTTQNKYTGHCYPAVGGCMAQDEPQTVKNDNH